MVPAAKGTQLLHTLMANWAVEKATFQALIAANRSSISFRCLQPLL